MFIGYAPAKLNIGLTIYPKNKSEKSLHKLESIFCSINLFDKLEVKVKEKCANSKLTLFNSSLPPSNTLTKAFEVFKSIKGGLPNIDLILTKKIPQQAGLGGASSDAACLFRILERVTGKKLTEKECYEAAKKVGSDVHFFMNCSYSNLIFYKEEGKKESVDKEEGLINSYKGEAALVTGTGDIVRMIEKRADLRFILIDSGVKVSTVKAYEALDTEGKKLVNILKKSDNLLENNLVIQYTSPISTWKFTNTFMKMLEEDARIKKSVQVLQESGAAFTSLTGSGGVVYGVYQADKCLIKTASFIRKNGFTPIEVI